MEEFAHRDDCERKESTPGSLLDLENFLIVGISVPVSLADLLLRHGRQLRTAKQLGELLQRVAWAPTHPYRGQLRSKQHSWLRRIEV